MAIPHGRKRVVSPNFFHDEDLLSLAPIDRLLFLGLFAYADKAGRLLDKPIELKIKILPLDAVDVDAALDRLAAKRLIRRYRAGKIRALALKEEVWREIQNLHPNEPGSGLPPPPVVRSRSSRTVLEHQKHLARGVSRSGSSGSSVAGSSVAGSSDPIDDSPAQIIERAKRVYEELLERAVFWPRHVPESDSEFDQCQVAVGVLSRLDPKSMVESWAQRQPDLEVACRDFLRSMAEVDGELPAEFE